ncbi:MAG: hypothetical protein RIG77_17430 [Cyclobacteriaceae bacterium]
MKLRIKNTDLTIKLFGWLQIIGGIIGIGVVSWLTMNIGEVNGAILLIILFGYFLFSYSIYSGIKLLNSETLKLGLVLSIINFCFQVIQFKILGYGLTYTIGTAFSIGYEIDKLKFNFEIISSQFYMSLATTDGEFKFMLNIMAIFFLVVLFDIWDEVTSEQGEVELDTLEPTTEE